MANDELRPRPVPRPVAGPGALRADQLPGDGRPPMRTGSVHMSDYTRQQLQAVGWKDGDPVPGDLGKRLQEIQQEVIEERQAATLEGSPLAADWKPVQASFVNITDLPPERQAEIQQYLAEYKSETEQQAQFEQMQTDVEASIPANVQGEQRDLMRNQILASNAAAQARQLQRGNATDSVVIDDRPSPTAPPQKLSTPEKIAILNQQQQAAAQPAQTQQAVLPLPDSGVAPARTNCQRCAWPLDVPYEIVPTVEDKKGFLAAILGMSRFEKKYDLLNGNLSVFFRSLSADESAVVQEQLGAMVRNGTSFGDGEYWANLQEFRTVLSVSKIVVGGNVVYSIPPFNEWLTENPPPSKGEMTPTQLPRLCAYFYAKGATQEPIRRIIGQTHKSFQRLVEAMEFMTNDPDFWSGIKLHA